MAQHILCNNVEAAFVAKTCFLFAVLLMSLMSTDLFCQYVPCSNLLQEMFNADLMLLMGRI